MSVVLCGVYKAYEGQPVLENCSLCFTAGERVALRGDSGVGKTTLTRLLLGLERPDAGKITGLEGLRFSAVFQEDRLCEGLSALGNVALVQPRPDPPRIVAALRGLGLPGDELHKPAAQLSGGQRRRVALVRALEADSDFVILDEAFKGLDETNRNRAYAYVLNRIAGRTLLVVTHDGAEAAALSARTITL